MTFAMYTSPESYTGNTTPKVSEVCLHRQTETRLVIDTLVPLTDEQMSDLYWLTLLMMKTGKRMKDLIGGK